MFHRLADAAGQEWKSTDPEYLEAWIAGRNSALTVWIPRPIDIPLPDDDASGTGWIDIK